MEERTERHRDEENEAVNQKGKRTGESKFILDEKRTKLRPWDRKN